jgi:raffinose/stachyose/melibiose transport system permease protein
MTTTETESQELQPQPAADRAAGVGGSRLRKRKLGSKLAVHGILIGYSLIALGPIVLIVMNSMKDRGAIFQSPFTLPTADTVSLAGYETVFARADFVRYFSNSITVTVVSVFLTVLFGAMAAYALTEYKVKIAPILLAYLALGIMVPIRLGTVSLLQLMAQLNLVNTRTALVLVYVAMGLPLAVVLLSQYFRQAPLEIREAARVDGASEYRVFAMMLPLIRPGLGAVAVASMLPIWNDLWFPLILTPGESVRTVTLGAQLFLGQFVSDWNAVLAVLTLAMVPMMALFVIFSKQFVRGLTSGAVK